jgi:YD repeat-containing protein
MKNKVWICLVLSVTFLALTTARAQNYIYATGNPTFSAQIPIENGFINVNNGDIHIEIPLAVHQQRGRLNLNERLVYDSRIWKINLNPNTGGYWWQPTNVPGSMGGWSFYSGIESGSVGYSTRPSSAGCLPYTVNWYFNWTDPQGTTHSFPGVQTLKYNYVPPNCNPLTTGVNQTANSSGYASDGSGYLATVTNYTDVVITDKEGNQFSPAVIESNPSPTTPEVTDSNGNFWSQDSNGNLIDTLGRTPVKVSQSGNQTYYDVLGFNGVLNRYTVTTETVNYSTSFSQSAVTDVSGSFTAIQSISLPDGSSYSFTYDPGSYGELTSVTLPSGGVIQYTYTNFLDSFQNMNRWVHTRVKDGGTTTFAPSTISNCTGSAGCQEKMIVTDPSQNDTVYTFTLDSSTVLNASSWNTAIDAYKGLSTSGGTKIKSVDTAYAYASYPVSLNEAGVDQIVGSYLVPSTITTDTILQDAGYTSQTLTALDGTGTVPTSVKMWDYYSGSTPSTPTVQTAYLYYGLFPRQVTVSDGSGNQISETTYSYDQGTPAPASPVHSGAPITGVRNNLTTTAQWVNSTGATLNTTATYDTAGTVLTSTDPNGTTTYHYDSTDTFATSIAPPTPYSGVSLTSTASYDPSTGLLLTTTDPNGLVTGANTTYVSYDWAGRPTQINYPDQGQMIAGYTATSAGSQNQIVAGSWTSTQNQFDGYGRLSRQAVGNGQSTNPYYQTDYCYDANGRLQFKSYPYQGTGWGTPKVCSGAGDSYTYDALGRPLTITHSDGYAYAYAYTGRSVKTTDENGVQRILLNGAFGQIDWICELSSNSQMPSSGAPVNCGLDIAGTGFLTQYGYSLPSHEMIIAQGNQTRVFQTDWLGRPILATEPERGNTTYSYAYSTQPGLGLTVIRSRGTANQANPSNSLRQQPNMILSAGLSVSSTPMEHPQRPLPTMPPPVGPRPASRRTSKGISRRTIASRLPVVQEASSDTTPWGVSRCNIPVYRRAAATQLTIERSHIRITWPAC